MIRRTIYPEIIKSYKNNHKDVNASFYYYRTFEKKEIDLIILEDGNLSLIECKSGESYSKEDTKVFKELNDSKYNITKNAIVCTTHTIYPIGEDCYVLPISAI